MAKCFVALPVATVMGSRFDTAEQAAAHIGKKVDADGVPHVIVEVLGEVRRRSTPNVEMVPFAVAEVANG